MTTDLCIWMLSVDVYSIYLGLDAIRANVEYVCVTLAILTSIPPCEKCRTYHARWMRRGCS